MGASRGLRGGQPEPGSCHAACAAPRLPAGPAASQRCTCSPGGHTRGGVAGAQRAAQSGESSPHRRLPAKKGAQHAVHLRSRPLQGGCAPVGRQAEPAGRKLERQAGEQLQGGQRRAVEASGVSFADWAGRWSARKWVRKGAATPAGWQGLLRLRLQGQPHMTSTRSPQNKMAGD